jgi:hypothetical protein
MCTQQLVDGEEPAEMPATLFLPTACQQRRTRAMKTSGLGMKEEVCLLNGVEKEEGTYKLSNQPITHHGFTYNLSTELILASIHF